MKCLWLLVLLTGCAAVVPAGSDEAAFVEQGARRVAAADRAALLVGNTLVADGVTVHYARDGTKRIATETGEQLERRWRLREDGIFCEELVVSGVEVCGEHGKLYVKNGLYRAFRPDGSAAPLAFRIEPGAPVLFNR